MTDPARSDPARPGPAGTGPGSSDPAGNGGASDGPLLEVRDAEVAYGAVTAVRGISLRVEAGEVVALLGANGAGKTTTLRMISGLLPPARGAVWFDGTRIAGAPLSGPAPAAPPVRSAPAERAGRVSRGRHRDAARQRDAAGQRDVPGLPVHRVTALGISHVPEGRRIFPAMTVAENLAMGAYLDRRRDRAETLRGLDRVHALFPRLAERSRQPAGTLSGGEQQMLAIGRALMARPRLILLDEPSLGLAPLLVATIFEVIREINAGGTTVLLVEQNAAAALRISHRGYVLDTGTVVLEGGADDLARDARVRDAYLGGSDEPRGAQDTSTTNDRDAMAP
ncbi:ABC transporter ATP-binding protein [Parafrankia colletiae]|uniref:ABC transporter ATP-binding protein n=1 Tax=Parafrankia colletiae TaxID=573497 RepID=A0A1S1RJE8_9ACTN|nr:ABC transporter ATP-binding protein [Parafrankia colletiae]MCK9899783.1 ABC transporter ATP-binding protein [Frankia sp. Cpl3]OHV46340.1 ABC transporter ATP-binding protein [Parafrankia colletiae]